MELLIRVVDKNEDEAASKAGDVLAACDDGWAWSAAELAHDDWRIVRVALHDVEVEALLSSSQVETVRRRREYKVDLAALPDPDLYIGTRSQGIIDVVRGRFVSATVKKP